MTNLIKAFVRHPVAPNLAMVVMVIAGLWASAQLTRQLLPSFAASQVDIAVAWPGAAAEDVEALITQPLEDALQGLDDLVSSSSTSQEGSASIQLEFPESADVGQAQDQVKDKISQVRNLPATSETPQVSVRARNESVTRMVITGPGLDELRTQVNSAERELRQLGFSRLTIAGLPKEEIAIEIPADRLSDLDLSLQDISNRVRGESQDLPAGTVGSLDVARQLRSLDQKRTVEGFEQVPVTADSSGRFLRLGDVARIQRQSVAGETLVFANGKPAVEIRIERSESEDALDAAEKLYDWLEQAVPNLPPNFDVVLYSEVWRTVDGRIDLMVKNALSGLALVLIILFVFLNARVAFWVSVGIPVALLASLVALFYFGGTINIMTLFALIMTFGIIVDDAIVVGERAVTYYQDGAGPVAASEKAALSMLAPVTAASLTTIAAFVPLMTIGGSFGSFLFPIPLIVVCVVIASLIECFIVLPGHLRHSLQKTSEKQPPAWRRKIDVAFRRFQDGTFRSILQWSIENRRLTLSIALASIILTLGLVLGGRLGFSFFPQPEGTTITANARFVAGAPEERVARFLEDAQEALGRAEAEVGEDIITLTIKKLGEDSRGTRGSNLGYMVVELLPGDERSVTNAELIRAWQRNITTYPGQEYFLILNSRGGPPGADIDVQITGGNPQVLKNVSLELQQILGEFSGVSGIRDDTSFGREQFIIDLLPVGQALGLTGQDLGEQLRAKFEGELVQIFQDDGNEIEVRVRLAEEDRQALRSLETLPVTLPGGGSAILSDVARLDYAQGFDALKHSDGRLAIRVTADVDPDVNNANAIRVRLDQEIMPELVAEFGVNMRLRGQAESQASSLDDLSLALPLALLLIYIILAWVFQSYMWPFAVLMIVPFGIVGAVFGHWVLGFDITLLSIFGFFGLTGIVINDSIILVDVYRRLRDQGKAAVDAVLEAGCSRLRAVFLTSVTTVAGIMPLLLETSREAQFLKPMVISISFGLIFGTLLVLILLPAILIIMESLRERALKARSQFAEYLKASLPENAIVTGLSKGKTRNDPATKISAAYQKGDSHEG